MALTEQLDITVDPANDANPATESYVRYTDSETRAVFIGAAHLPEARDMITLYRTEPTKSGNFKGVKKTACKFTLDQTVDGVDGTSQLTVPAIVDVSFSLPVGMTDAAMEHIRQKVIGLLDDSTTMWKINAQQLI